MFCIKVTKLLVISFLSIVTIISWSNSRLEIIINIIKMGETLPTVNAVNVLMRAAMLEHYFIAVAVVVSVVVLNVL